MLSRNQIKHLKSLQQHKYRYLNHEFVAEGTKLVLDLLSSEFEIKIIYATKDWLEKNSSHYDQKNIRINETSAAELGKISALKTASEVFALVKMPEWSLDIQFLSTELVVMLDSIRDPGNLGTIIRTADWFGIKSIICSEDSVDVYNPKVVQATMGSVASVKVHYQDLKEVLSQVEPDTKVYGTFMDGDDISTMNLTDKGIVIIGSEANGISPVLFPFINERLGIKASDNSRSESLNAAIACSIVLYEIGKSS